MLEEYQTGHIACSDVEREGLSGKAILQMLVSIVDQSFNPVAAAFSRKCQSYTVPLKRNVALARTSQFARD